jgi:capsule polysaccharide export protein KpsC/LpsZ
MHGWDILEMLLQHQQYNKQSFKINKKTSYIGTRSKISHFNVAYGPVIRIYKKSNLQKNVMLWGILFLEQLLKPFHSSVTANPNKRQQN